MAHPAGQPSFDVGALVSQSWQIVIKNAAVLIVGALIIVVIQSALNLIGAKLHLPGAGQLLLSGPLALGYCGVALRAARGQTPQIPDLFEGFQRFLPAFVANLIICIFLGIGTALCVLPGIFVGFIYCLTYFYMYDKKTDFWPSMESSRVNIMAAMAAWAPVYLVVLVLNIVGIIVCGVGLLLTVPISAVLLALAYDQASGVSAPIDTTYQS